MPPLDGDEPAGVTVRRTQAPPGSGATHGVCSHDDIAKELRASVRGVRSPMSGWTSVAGPSTRRRRFGRRLGLLLLLLPLVTGVLDAPANIPGVHGDELSDARARRAQLMKDVAAQKARVAHLAAMQSGLSADIHQTASELHGTNANLDKVKVKITAMQGRIDAVQGQYDELVVQLADLDAELVQVQSQEATKRSDLAARQALLADRVRSAYDSDRTSLLESFLSSGTFTDVLAEMS
ncbi:MAG: hypothetical protein QOJ75_2235, partial [Chloroflexota bacterium]|nr:hypothetical protein [Chloroflexota bacterium]